MRRITKTDLPSIENFRPFLLTTGKASGLILPFPRVRIPFSFLQLPNLPQNLKSQKTAQPAGQTRRADAQNQGDYRQAEIYKVHHNGAGHVGQHTRQKGARQAANPVTYKQKAQIGQNARRCISEQTQRPV